MLLILWSTYVVPDEAMQHKSVPVCIRAALLRELVDVSLNVCHQDANVPDIELGQGGEQGGTETPTAWNTLLDHVLGPVVQKWLADGSGVILDDDDDPINNAIWADDIFLFAHSLEAAGDMAQDATAALAHGHLAWKPGSLCCLANTASWF